MSKDSGNGCLEYNELSRRQFLIGAGKTAAVVGTASAWLPQVIMAQEFNSSRDVVMQIFLRGGCDGLSLCAPFGDPGYYSARPTIAIPQPDSSNDNKGINLDGFFCLSPRMAPLMEAYNAGHLLFVHATGLAKGTRSHFDDQRFMEMGVYNSGIGTGWLGRHLAAVPAMNGGTVLRGVSLTDAVPLTLAGGPLTAPVPDVTRYGIVGHTTSQSKQRARYLTAAYDREKDILKSTAANTINTINLLAKINFDSYVPGGGARYPNTGFGYAMKSAAALIRSDVGVEAFHYDYGGWDTHAGQGTNGGQFANLLSDLAGSLGALHTDLAATDRINSFTLVVVSEFGRNVIENASQGTDHGHGNAMIVMGGGIAGGRVLSQWPGLAFNKLFEGQDLQITIDHRDILAEVVQKRLADNDLAGVFPGYTPTFRGVTVA